MCRPLADFVNVFKIGRKCIMRHAYVPPTEREEEAAARAAREAEAERQARADRLPSFPKELLKVGF